MPIAVSCPTCGARFSVADELYKRRFAGRIVTVRCKHCQSAIRFDASEPPVDAKPAPPPAPEHVEHFVPKRPPAPPRPPQPTRPGVVALSAGLLDTAPVIEEEDEKTPNTRGQTAAAPPADAGETIDVTEFAQSEPPPALTQERSPEAVDENFLIGLKGDSLLSAALASPALPHFEEAPTRRKRDTTSPVSRSGVPRSAGASRTGRRLWPVVLVALVGVGLAYLILAPKLPSSEPIATSSPAPPARSPAKPPAFVDRAPPRPAADAPAAALPSSVSAPLGTSAVDSPAAAQPSVVPALSERAPARVPIAAAAKSVDPASVSEPAPPRPVQAGEPLDEPEAPVVTDPFDRSAAVSALASAAEQASGCKKANDPSGMATVTVIFAPSGRVTSATLSGPPFAGTQTGGCIAASLRRARVPPFAGESVTVSKTVNVR